jgi:acyl carrier protein
MNSDSTQGRVEEIVATIFNLPVETISLDSSPQTIENWDSMGHLMLILELEQQFSVQLAPEEVETLTSVRSIVELLQARG